MTINCKHKWKKMDWDYKLCVKCGTCIRKSHLSILPEWDETTFDSMTRALESRKSDRDFQEKLFNESREKALQYLRGKGQVQ